MSKFCLILKVWRDGRLHAELEEVWRCGGWGGWRLKYQYRNLSQVVKKKSAIEGGQSSTYRDTLYALHH